MISLSSSSSPARASKDERSVSPSTCRQKISSATSAALSKHSTLFQSTPAGDNSLGSNSTKVSSRNLCLKGSLFFFTIAYDLLLPEPVDENVPVLWRLFNSNPKPISLVAVGTEIIMPASYYIDP